MNVWQSQMDLGELAQGRFDRGDQAFIAKRLAESPAGKIRLMESICERENLKKALSRVESNAGAPGVDAKQIILGGPMMGQAAASLDVPITKGMSGVLVLRGEDLAGKENQKTYPCIKCAECVESCPMGLNPSQLGMLAAKREYDLMGSDYHLGECFECGCCTYVCPSNIPLVQQFRIAKQILREKAVAK